MSSVQSVIDKFNAADKEIKTTFPKVDPRLVVALIFDHNAKEEDNIYTRNQIKAGSGYAKDSRRCHAEIGSCSWLLPKWDQNGT